MLENRKKIILISIATIVVIVSIISVVLLYRGISRLNEVTKKLEGSIRVLNDFYNADPFPSEENIESEKENLKIIRHWYQEMNRSLSKGQIIPDNKSPSAFMTLLGEVKNDLMESAKKSGTAIPAQFSFGFDRYFASGSALPDPADVGRLTQQLRIIEKLCKNLYDSRANSIIAIKRDEFEPPVKSAAMESARGRRRRENVEEEESPTDVKGTTYKPDAGLLKPGALFSKFHFLFEFTAREQALIDFLNSLAKEDMHVVVTTLRVEKNGPDILSELPLERKEREKKDKSDDKMDQPSTRWMKSGEAEKKITQETKEDKEKQARDFLRELSRKERLVCGVALDKPMKIRLEVDVYNFPVN